MAEAPSIVTGELVAHKQEFAIVASRFNEFITTRLVDGALDALKRHGCSLNSVTVVWVPGSWEMPLTAKKLAATGQYDVVICLGCIIRGDTPHFDQVCNAASRGIADASMATNVPIVFGVLTTETLEHAINRAGAKAGNKGVEAAMTAIEMANLFAKLEGKAV